jgi:hypothetical protein
VLFGFDVYSCVHEVGGSADLLHHTHMQLSEYETQETI